MASIELYINKQLCDIEDQSNFSVYLKRQLINPSELSTKDAQRSYDITLPASPTNNKIFGHTNTEEVKGKFAELYDATLYVNHVKIFEGKFRMSEITKTYYKGNLGIPAAKTVKDIFGEKKMNEVGTWNVPFTGVTSINKYNREEDPDCFFPLVLYGLMSKKALSQSVQLHEKYSFKDEIDNTVLLKMEDFPPSVNCLRTIKKLFSNSGCHISGSAFDDERLAKLYMSYQNPSDYDAPWITGLKPYVKVHGVWRTLRKYDKEESMESNYTEGGRAFKVDLFNSDNFDHWTYINNTNPSKKYEIKIPVRGLYKIRFNTTLHLRSLGNRKSTASVVPAFPMNDFSNRRLELKLMRIREGESLNLAKLRFDNTFYKDNIDQTLESTTRYFPSKGYPNLIDPAVNENLLCGFAFGKIKDSSDLNPLNPPQDEGKRYPNNTIAIKGGKSWTGDDFKRSFAAINSRYSKYENGKGEDYPDYQVRLKNTPRDSYSKIDGFKGEGDMFQVVWLEKGDLLTVVTLSDGGLTQDGRFGWVNQEIAILLEIEAFKSDKNWLKLNDEGWSTEEMNWKEAANFDITEMDLIKFLPSSISANSWIENFCKTFNLNLVQIGDNKFELNTKNKENNNMLIIDLDQKTDVNILRSNTSLNLPKSYNIGFKIDEKEHGFALTQNTGREIIETGSISDKEEKKDFEFSYNWLKNMICYTDRSKPSETIPTPVISDNEVWRYGVDDYEEMMDNKYMDKPQRFWYKSNDNIHQLPAKLDNQWVYVAEVSNNLDGARKMTLDFKNEPNSILSTYFLHFADIDNSYTSVECYLSPEEYSNIDNSLLRLNGDLYFVAEVDGYDPLNRKKAQLKLIRKHK